MIPLPDDELDRARGGGPGTAVSQTSRRLTSPYVAMFAYRGMAEPCLIGVAVHDERGGYTLAAVRTLEEGFLAIERKFGPLASTMDVLVQASARNLLKGVHVDPEDAT